LVCRGTYVTKEDPGATFKSSRIVEERRTSMPNTRGISSAVFPATCKHKVVSIDFTRAPPIKPFVADTEPLHIPFPTYRALMSKAVKQYCLERVGRAKEWQSTALTSLGWYASENYTT
jgi:hypothetical protein